MTLARVASIVLALITLLIPQILAFQGDSLEAYRTPTRQLIEAALADDEGWERLTYLCDQIGHRLSGSDGLERAVLWTAEEMERAGLENVWKQPVGVPYWVRGEESAEMLAPYTHSLPMLGLGGSVGTPAEGITAEVVSVSSFDDLAALPDAAVVGKIVLFNVEYEGYGRTVRYRGAGAVEAAKRGAVASLVRSIGPVSLQTPHTGGMSYDDAVKKIPSAAITIEGATLIHRLIAAGRTVRVRLRMQAETRQNALSANVIGEIRGREKPEEVVVLGGHLDSWDVGQGAHDDGAGSIASLQAVALMKKLGLRPRRTVRVVLWTNEENGLAGGNAYAEWVGDKVHQHVAAIEMDGGSEKPQGFGVTVPGMDEATQGNSQVNARLLSIAALLQPIPADQLTWGGGGADIGPLMQKGVPGFGHRTEGGKYFHWHHTEADTIDKIKKEDFQGNTAALAVLAYILAEMPERVADFLSP